METMLSTVIVPDLLGSARTSLPKFDDAFIALVMRWHELRLAGDQAKMKMLLSEMSVPEAEQDLICREALVQIAGVPSMTAIAQALQLTEQIDQQFRNGSLNRRQRRLALKRSDNLLKVTGLVFPGWPKSKLNWYFMRHAFGEENFNWLILPTARHARGENRINFPARLSDLSGFQLPFALAAAGLSSDITGLPDHVIRKSTFLTFFLGKDIGLSLIKAMFMARIIFPPQRILVQLAEVIKRGLRGETVIITGAFCPDYGYEPTGSPTTPWRYTFDSVGTGVGLVAQQFVRILPVLLEFFDQHKIKYRLILSIGDFEADSPEICQKVGCPQPEFIDRCRQSLVAFRQALPDIPMELNLFEQEWAPDRWYSYRLQARSLLRQGDFGFIRQYTGKEPEHEVAFIAADSRSFYDQWYNRMHDDQQLRELVIEQASEYAAVGRIMAEDFRGLPVLQIAGDRPKMQIFAAMYEGANFPILCAQRVY